jgi:hypothetical protein
MAREFLVKEVHYLNRVSLMVELRRALESKLFGIHPKS